MTSARSKKAKKGGKSNSKLSIADTLLSTMVAVQVRRNESCISFVSLMKARKMNNRNTPWRNEWRNLIEEGYIRPFTSSASKGSSKSSEGGVGSGTFMGNYELTHKGEDRAGSPEQKAIKRLMETTVNTTAQEHDRIRKLCMNNRAVEIFDLLLKHGSLTRKELAATIGISDRGAPFSYGLRQLKRLGCIVVDEKNAQRGVKLLMVSDQAFMNPKDRPEPVPIDPETMGANMEKVYGKEMRKAATKRSCVKKEAIVKAETDNVVKTEHNVDDDKGQIDQHEDEKGDAGDCGKVEDRKIARVSMKRKELPKNIKKEASSKSGDSTNDDDCLVKKHEETSGDSKRGFNDCGKVEQQKKTRWGPKVLNIIRNGTLSTGAKG